jgi:hypothetical protein
LLLLVVFQVVILLVVGLVEEHLACVVVMQIWEEVI